MTAIVELKNVTKVIKGKKIIDDLSFSIKEGEVFGFLGPNGAGKTTTIRMIVGLMKLTSGDVLIKGNSIQKNYDQAIQHVGAIVENPELYKFLTGYQNLMQYARMVKGVSKERIAEVVELVGLTDAIHSKVKTYSLGMRQRLGLAQCLLHKPQVMILDEPTNGLDPAGIREIRDYIRKLARDENMSVIVSSHLLSEMELMCDRIAIIQKGKLTDVQTVHDFVQGNEQIYLIETSTIDKTIKLLKEEFDLAGRKTPAGIEVPLLKEQVPAIIKHLVENEVDVFGVKALAKSLEDRFLEVTNL
ncbi:ABC transporter ATP-binding protein [Falsibacillus pallidus]|uniref:ABC-2 type transport system ATP-binding protein n=1 Tax=Falsibacillus pallidus TaxID=493781 RepID=A0A370GJZ4_9BACI|nr:ABC transporter ATP-binding protein [Falsibacillus pallidus]RDI44102.1 ABC-2 type transport system ATP-binding protein [Falsibacillus pallidus]